MKLYFILISAALSLSSCSVFEKASSHGFDSGYYSLRSKNKEYKKIYADVTDEKISLFQLQNKKPDTAAFCTIMPQDPDVQLSEPMLFKKNSLDIDLTAIPLKYRPSVYGLPAQLNADFNAAVYAGWRHDRYKLKTQKTPLGKNYCKTKSLGYDFGLFAGPGATIISPFTTQNRRADEYSALIIQTGAAAFIESNLMSFGLAFGYDYLLNNDRNIWIYRNKPWVGFIIGVALI